MLKNKLIALLVSAGMCLACAPGMADGQAFEVLTSFYPMYLLTVNVAGGIDGVNVKNMAEQNVGCLHDYTLRTGDMRMIHAADVVVINGAGMESFTDKILTDQQKPVIVASEGIDLICDDDEDEDHDHDHDHDGHDHSDENAHVWMSPKQAIKQVENIAEGLIEQDPAHADAYRKNADAYIERLNKLDKQVEKLLSGVQGAKIVTSHPAFEYLARDYGIEIVASLGQEPGEMPRTRDMARLVDDVRDMDIRALFVEKAYSERAAEVLARETGIEIYALDSLTSGDMDEEAYERGILADAQTLKEALENADA
jgi:zinc transport system substrate-binding protein